MSLTPSLWPKSTHLVPQQKNPLPHRMWHSEMGVCAPGSLTSILKQNKEAHIQSETRKGTLTGRSAWHRLLLLLLLSHFSRVRLCVTPETAAYPAPLSPGLSRQEHEWVAISFSNAWKRKLKVKSLSRVRLLATTWTVAHQAPLSMGFSRQEYWSGVPLPSPLAQAVWALFW